MFDTKPNPRRRVEVGTLGRIPRHDLNILSRFKTMVCCDGTRKGRHLMATLWTKRGSMPLATGSKIKAGTQVDVKPGRPAPASPGVPQLMCCCGS